MPVLQRMTERAVIESDGSEAYRLKPVPKQVTRGRVWVSAEIAKLFQRSGKEFTQVMTLDDVEAYYDRL